MFQRKKPEAAKPENDSTGDGGTDDISSPPLKPFSRKGSHAPTKPPSPTSFHPEAPRRSIPDIPGVPPRRIERPMSAEADSKRLVIGRDICLNGEITACDKLVVEGRAEVVLTGAGIIEVAPSGFFKGSATVEEADISGRYEGELIVRDRLIVGRLGLLHVRDGDQPNLKALLGLLELTGYRGSVGVNRRQSVFGGKNVEVA